MFPERMHGQEDLLRSRNRNYAVTQSWIWTQVGEWRSWERNSQCWKYGLIWFVKIRMERIWTVFGYVHEETSMIAVDAWLWLCCDKYMDELRGNGTYDKFVFSGDKMTNLPPLEINESEEWYLMSGSSQELWWLVSHWISRFKDGNWGRPRSGEYGRDRRRTRRNTSRARHGVLRLVVVGWV